MWWFSLYYPQQHNQSFITIYAYYFTFDMEKVHNSIDKEFFVCIKTLYHIQISSAKFCADEPPFKLRHGEEAVIHLTFREKANYK